MNKIVEDVWDIEEIIAKDVSAHNARAIETRNLESFCQAITECVLENSNVALRTGINAWITIAQYASRENGQALMDFLNAPFVSAAAGIAIAGTISGQINEATKKECSTSSSEADVISAALNGALAHHPTGEDLTVTVNGPSGSWTITVNAAPEGEKPPATCHQ